MSSEDMSRTLSRTSTGLTYLLADTCDGDTSHVSGDVHSEATLPRFETDWTRYAPSPPHEAYKSPTNPLDCPDLFPLLCNRPGSRASIGTISTVSTLHPGYATTMHPYLHYLPQQSYPPHHQSMVQTNYHPRPGYVTLPRRPKQSHQRSLSTGDSLGPRTSADGCSHSNISTLPMNSHTNISTLNRYMDHHCQATTVLPPYSPPPPASLEAINKVGLPTIHLPSYEEDTPLRTSTPKSAADPTSPPPSRAQLDTIPEQE